MKIVAYGKTDVGLSRELNEDAYYVDDSHKCFLVCDGLGGHKAGDLASFLAVEIISGKKLIDEDVVCYGKEESYDEFGNQVCNLIKKANYYIFSQGYEDASVLGMGTTVCGLFFKDNKAYIPNVGDSRLYFISEQAIEQITEDHSWVNDQVKSEHLTRAQAQEHPMKNIITRALGQGPEVKVDLFIEDIKPGYYLLCTDGLSNMVQDEDLKRIVIENKWDLEAGCDKLIAEAKAKGGSDNITVVLVQVV